MVFRHHGVDGNVYNEDLRLGYSLVLIKFMRVLDSLMARSNSAICWSNFWMLFSRSHFEAVLIFSVAYYPADPLQGNGFRGIE